LLKHADEIGEEQIDVAIGGAVGKVGKPQKVHRGWRRQRVVTPYLEAEWHQDAFKISA
jgi:hypothetical protein